MICKLCKKEKIVSKALGVCKECILLKWENIKKDIKNVHKISRKEFGLSETLPWEKSKKPYVQCTLCSNKCKIKENEFGFCGLRKNEKGKLVSFVNSEKALLEYYYDPIPTNCVASYWCNAEKGKYNLAIFYGACSFNCLFCQNWQFRSLTKKLSPIVSKEKLLEAVNENVYCVCFFGGDPSCQLPFTIKFCKQAKEINRNLRFCLETNGNANPKLLKKFAELAFESNGLIKFDLKFWHEELSLAICGVSNRQVFKNFEMVALRNSKQVVASTLLLPGYVDEYEVYQIAKFIASFDQNIPYALLAFYPCFWMKDLPLTSKGQAIKCLRAAKKAGLKNVRLGNVHLLM
jgi:pyruvate formate lyase activating enzyme